MNICGRGFSVKVFLRNNDSSREQQKKIIEQLLLEAQFEVPRKGLVHLFPWSNKNSGIDKFSPDIQI